MTTTYARRAAAFAADVRTYAAARRPQLADQEALAADVGAFARTLPVFGLTDLTRAAVVREAVASTEGDTET